MKLFDGFEAIKFPEENMIFITHNGYLYYIYRSGYKYWKRYENAGNDHITTENYQDISIEELTTAMHGVFPQKETDFLRLCDSSQLGGYHLLCLLKEDYVDYMSDYTTYHTARVFISESDIPYKSYEQLKILLDNAVANNTNSQQLVKEIKTLSFDIIGRDIYKKEIGIVDGHDYTSYFWIMPARVIDYSNTNEIDNVAEMRSSEISIEENDVEQYLTPFLYNYYDDSLEANKKRVEFYEVDDDGNEHPKYISGFVWWLTYNFFTFDSITAMLRDIADTIDALTNGIETEYTKKLKIKRGSDSETELIIDFYHRFIYRMEYMLKVGKEKGYNLISFMGP
jgi:hypothetical protein